MGRRWRDALETGRPGCYWSRSARVDSSSPGRIVTPIPGSAISLGNARRALELHRRRRRRGFRIWVSAPALQGVCEASSRIRQPSVPFPVGPSDPSLCLATSTCSSSSTVSGVRSCASHLPVCITDRSGPQARPHTSKLAARKPSRRTGRLSTARRSSACWSRTGARGR